MQSLTCKQKTIFRSAGPLLELMRFLTFEERLSIQLLCRYIYDVVSPMYCTVWELKNSKDRIWHFVDYYIFEYQLDDISKFIPHAPRNLADVKQHKKWKYARCVNLHHQNCLLAIGGEQIDNDQRVWTNQVIKYDILTNTISSLSPMKQGRSNFATVNQVKDSKIIVIGGVIEMEKTTNLVEQYDIRSNHWNDLPSLNFSRANPLVINISDCIYVFGGFIITRDSNDFIAYEVTKKFERLQLCSNEFEEIELTECMQNMFLLSTAYPYIISDVDSSSNDKILIFGGYEGNATFSSLCLRVIDLNYFHDIIKYCNHENSTITPNMDPFIGCDSYIDTSDYLFKQLTPSSPQYIYEKLK